MDFFPRVVYLNKDGIDASSLTRPASIKAPRSSSIERNEVYYGERPVVAGAPAGAAGAVGHAHLDFEKAIAGLLSRCRGSRPPGLPHSPWRLVEHMRIAQWDILRFSVDPKHISPEFPGGYWHRGRCTTRGGCLGTIRRPIPGRPSSDEESVSNPDTDLSNNPSLPARERRSFARPFWLLITRVSPGASSLLFGRLLGAWR